MVENFLSKKRRSKMKKLFTTKNLVLMAMFSALAAVLHMMDFPIPFIAPGFYEMDLSEIPIMIGSFIMGPVSGVIMEAVKILLKLIIKGTSTAYVGDLANFCIGCCLIVPAAIIYKHKKTKKNAFMGMAVGTLVMIVAGAVINYYIMIPFFAKFFGTPIDDIIKMGKAISPLVSSRFMLVLICVVPFNFIKGAIDGLITSLVYKRISVFIKQIGNKK